MITERHRTEATLRDYKRRMLRVLVHVQQHLDDSVSLAELAQVACFSPYHFHRIFTGMLGESVKDHVRRLRLERAAGQLKHSPLPVTRIALDAGYETHESFTRAFKAAYGIAPVRYRSAKRSAGSLAARSGVHYVGASKLKTFKTIQPGVKTMNVQIKIIQPMRVAFMRHVGPYSEVGNLWDRFLPRLGKQGLIGGDAIFLGLCHDDPDVTPPDKLRYDACVSVDQSFLPEADIGVQMIAGGEYAATTHFGPYQSWARLTPNCSDNGCRAVAANCVRRPLSTFISTAQKTPSRKIC